MELPKYDPLPRPDSVIQGDHYRFTVLSPALIRMEWSEGDYFEDRASSFAVHRSFPKTEFSVEETPDRVDIYTSQIWLQYVKGPFSAGTLTATQLALPRGHWGMSWRWEPPSEEKSNTKDGNLGGTVRTLDKVHGRCDMGNGVLAHGIVQMDDHDTMLFEKDGWVGSREPGRYDGYLFCHIFDFRWALRDFFTLSGAAPTPPRSALGVWYTRFHPYTEKEYLGVMDDFLREGVPLSVAVIDIAWHLMDNVPAGTGGAWSGYTWEHKYYPYPERFLEALKARGLTRALNNHPNEGLRHFETKYEEVCKYLGLDSAKKRPIPFDVTNRRFLRAYFDIVLKDLEEQGVDLWWLDWQQNDKASLPNIDPLWILNHYHFLEYAKSGRRSMTLSRYAGLGSHRYPLGFSGDHDMSWDSLNFQPEFTATASNVGYYWWSHDIGGHLGGTKDDECTARWAQLGVVLPVLRLHNSNNPFNDRKPWSFDTESRSAMVSAYRLRTRLIPYIYTSAVEASLNNRTLIEPMYYEHPMHADAYRHRNAYMFGQQILAAPITQKRSAVTRLAKSTAWLPPGRWVDIFTGIVYDGDRIVAFHRDLQNIPLLLKQGSMVPLDAFEDAQHGSHLPEAIEVVLAVGADGEFTLIEDDSTGNDMTKITYAKTSLVYDQKKGKITIGPTTGPIVSNRTWSLYLPACNLSTITVNGQLIPGIQSETGVRFKLGLFPSETAVVVQLGDPPAFRPNHWKELCKQRIDLCHAEYDKKWQVWNSIRSIYPSVLLWETREDVDCPDDPLAIIVSRLLATGANGDLVNALMEVMLAESR